MNSKAFRRGIIGKNFNQKTAQKKSMPEEEKPRKLMMLDIKKIDDDDAITR